MTTSNVSALQELAARYGDAWNSHDLDAIMSMHSEDTSYHFHGLGGPHHGLQAVRAAFAKEMALIENMRFNFRAMLFGEIHFVFEAIVTGITTAGVDVSFDMVGLLIVNDGLIVTNDLYADLVALQGQLQRKS
ncbi:nuclear transport factor 2 family protein [Ktedonosporobacter rubrisoli]|nr:nuclear transport factor 2 family protein [Ktedonosporobacter rubrisoli]